MNGVTRCGRMRVSRGATTPRTRPMWIAGLTPGSLSRSSSDCQSITRDPARNKPMRELLRRGVACVWLILVPALAAAQSEIRVFVGGAMAETVKEAGAAFARSSGDRLVYVSDTTGALQKRLA